MQYLRVRNWDRFQQYKDRSPPWIKLYNSLLEDYAFNCLTETAKLHLLLIWLLASRLNNKIPADPEWIRQRIGAKRKPDLDALSEAGFLELTGREDQLPEQDACTALANCLPRERGRDRERAKRETEQRDVGPTGPDDVGDQVRDIWKRHLEARERYFVHKNGIEPPSTPDLTPELRRMIRESLRRHGLEKTRAAGVGLFYSAHHTGKNETGTEYLDPAICWRIKKDQNNVERFAALALEADALRTV